MHPIIARRDRLIPFMLAWLGIGVLLAAKVQASASAGWRAALVLAVPWTLLFGFASLSAWHLCRSFPLGAAGTLRLLSAQLSAALLSSALWVLLGHAGSQLLGRYPQFPGLAEAYDTQIPLFFGAGILLFLLAAAIHYLIITFERSQEAERRALELKVLAREAELRILKMQIDPHFLFNSLNSVSALIGSDGARAREMCLRLSEFLRGSLALAERELIPLSEELALARNYLEIEQVRFGQRLAVEVSVTEGAKDCLVPPLLLQPLIENAVKHGVGARLEGGSIVVRATRATASLRLQVENPCEPEAPLGKPPGIGLENVRSRLRTLYGSKGRLEVTRQEGTYSVNLTLPCREPGGPDDGSVP